MYYNHLQTKRTFSGKLIYRIQSVLKITVLSLITVLSGCDIESSRILATVDDHELSIDQLVELLARQNTVPNEPQIVGDLANFWVDYMLLALFAQEDSLLINLDLSPPLEIQFQQEIIDQYLKSTVLPDTSLSNDQLKSLWDADPPKDSVRARHILLTFPEQATQIQIDSVVRMAITIKNRTMAGESFEALARRFSEDPGSGQIGGDLGYFGPGTMVKPFEDATYALDVGGISDPVQSPAGMHIIQLVDRRPTTFESGKPAFREVLINQRVREADSIFLATLNTEANIRVVPEAAVVLKEIASRPRSGLNKKASRRKMVDYSEGSYTLGDLFEFIQTMPPVFATQIVNSSDLELNALLQKLGQDRVLLARAKDVGITMSEERRDTLYRMTREDVVKATDALGIRQITLLENETIDEGLDRTILQVMRELVAGTRSAIRLGYATVALRKNRDWSISNNSISTTVRRIDELLGSTDNIQPSVTPSLPIEAVQDTTENQ